MTGLYHLLGEAPPGIYKTHAEDGNSADPSEAIFPIVTQSVDGQYLLIGTGFFIAQGGIFVSAAHVVNAALDMHGNADKPLGIFQFLPDNQFCIRPISHFVCHSIADLAVGVLAPMHHEQTKSPLQNKAIPICKKLPANGDLVSTYAYPKTTITPGSPQKIKFMPTFFEGNIVKQYPDGRDRHFMPGACYQTTMVIHGGASGGPVIDKNGSVVAVNSTGFENDTISFVTCISQIFIIALPNIVFPETTEPRTATIRELCDRDLVYTK